MISVGHCPRRCHPYGSGSPVSSFQRAGQAPQLHAERSRRRAKLCRTGLLRPRLIWRDYCVEVFMSLGVVTGIADRACAFVLAGYAP